MNKIKKMFFFSFVPKPVATVAIPPSFNDFLLYNKLSRRRRRHPCIYIFFYYYTEKLFSKPTSTIKAQNIITIDNNNDKTDEGKVEEE